MPLQATSGAASYDAFGGGVPSEPNYIESVFSCFLYTGNGSTQTITNGIDLAGKGGMTWIKNRSTASEHAVFDTSRGINKALQTQSTAAEFSYTGMLTAFNSNGFSLGADGVGFVNVSGDNYASWTFRKAPKFFDVVTYTGNATAGRTIAHNLGSVPGCIIVKRLNGADNWTVYHRGIDSVSPQNYIIYLNTTDARSDQDLWADTAPTDSVFSVGDNIKVNGSSSNTYVAYLFAHNAGGFGLTGTDNVISCGSFTTDGSGNATVNLGYEPQFAIVKCSSNGGQNWQMWDVMRGWNMTTSDPELFANSSEAEAGNNIGNPTATGFTISGMGYSQTYIYIAIRRGPMKVPTSGTSVFSPQTATQTLNNNDMPSAGFPIDSSFVQARDGGLGVNLTLDRLRGKGGGALQTNSTSDESWTTYFNFDRQTNLYVTGNFQGTALPFVFWNFRRAPSFFDEVCYTGDNNAGRAITHNLTVVPEMIIVKKRSGTGDWSTYHVALGATKSISLNSTAVPNTHPDYWNDTTPTSTAFYVGGGNPNNYSPFTYVAYLFATCAGVSKVGSYTGTGTTQQINCGFTGGARFVLIKRTDSTGDWYVWDSARGIVSGNDPYLLLNSTAAEVTSTDYIDTYSAGFEISSTAPSAINASGGTFIFLAIA